MDKKQRIIQRCKFLVENFRKHLNNEQIILFKTIYPLVDIDDNWKEQIMDLGDELIEIDHPKAYEFHILMFQNVFSINNTDKELIECMKEILLI